MDLNAGKSFEDLNRKNIKAISRGGLGRSDGQLASLSENAIKTAKRALRSVPLNKIPRTRLSKEQLDQTNDANALGIPKALASHTRCSKTSIPKSSKPNSWRSK